VALGFEELEELIEEIQEKIKRDIFLYNRTDELDDYLEKIGFLEKEEREYERDAKVLIVGDSQVSKNNILKLAKKYKIDPDYIEFELGYDKKKHFNLVKLEYNTNYRCILFGPIPHSTGGKGDYSSIIAKMEYQKDKYPPVYRLENHNELKITKSNLEKTFQEIKSLYF
jgi:uncharacterized FAD-dependent dehydrogenase